VSLVSVPFRGDAPARNALMGNHIDAQMAADAGSLGNLRPLAVVGSNRSPSLPDVATTDELGFGAGFPTPFGVFVPKGVPDALVSRLRDACAETVKSEAFSKVTTASGQTIDYLDGPQFAARMQEVSGVIGALVNRLPSLRE
ncbi:MAG: tripartite tricarboxylate transporter substrate-binding protein, partial [Pseudorhodoplanes sp.]